MNILHVLGAMVLLSITALNTQRHQMELRQHQITSEVEMRATGLAARVLDHLGTLPFDPSEDDDPASFTPQSAFGGAASIETASFLHDVHGLTFTLTTDAPGASLEYEVDATVRYLDQASGHFVQSSTPTYFKEVTLYLTSPAGARMTVNRVFTPRS